MKNCENCIMMIDILQELFNAIVAGNDQEAEKYYRALEHYGWFDPVLKICGNYICRHQTEKEK